jgi:hypothetical protein
MKKNLTLAIEETTLDQARLAAAQRKKTLTGMVRDFLVSIAQEDQLRKSSLERLLKTMNAKPLRVGKALGHRDDLHAR